MEKVINKMKTLKDMPIYLAKSSPIIRNKMIQSKTIKMSRKTIKVVTGNKILITIIIKMSLVMMDNLAKMM